MTSTLDKRLHDLSTVLVLSMLQHEPNYQINSDLGVYLMRLHRYPIRQKKLVSSVISVLNNYVLHEHSKPSVIEALLDILYRQVGLAYSSRYFRN
jgi:hypothetical protein